MSNKTSQQNEKEKMKSSSGVNKQFSNENSVDTNTCADETSGTVQEIPNSSTSKTLNSHYFSSSKPEECCTACQCDKFRTVFVDVENDLVRSDYLSEEDEDICKVSSENLIADHKDIDYHLVKSVKVEQDVEGSSREIDINVQNLNAPVFIISDICTRSDSPGLAINQIHSKIKEEMDNCEDVSIINESVISIESDPLSKIESLRDIGEKIPVLDESSSDELPDKPNDAGGTKNIFIVHKPLKVCRRRKQNLQVRNAVENLNWTLQSDLQRKLETNSRDKNVQLNSKHNEKCQSHGNESAEPNVDRPFGCTVCGKAFADQSTLTAHKYIHSGSCSVCGKVCTTPSNLKVHKRRHTGNRPFGCTVCGKTFIQLPHLTGHKRIHTGEKPFGCTICGKTFTQFSSLKIHKRIHTEEKPFGCTICGKTFTQHNSLKSHKRIHTGEKPFVCTICGKMFTHHNSLKSHKHIHTGEKPFVCTICGKTSTRVSDLIIHKRIHTGEKPFGCTICGKAFTHCSNLKRHKRIHIR